MIHFQFDFRVQESKNEEQTMLSMIKGMMNIELMIKPLFLMIIISSFLGMLGFFVPIMFLPDMATLKGIEASQAGYLISIYGKYGMTTILMHTVAHFTKPFFMPKNNNQPSKFLSLALS